MENQIMSIFVQAVLTILGVLVSYLTTVAVSYLSKKKEALVKQMGTDQYNATYNIAKGLYFAIEQQFKFIPAAGEQKRKAFDDILLKKVPTLKQEDINHFREGIVGEINNQLNKTSLLAPAFDITKDEADVKVQQ
jgi:hypothetical protein